MLLGRERAAHQGPRADRVEEPLGDVRAEEHFGIPFPGEVV